VRLELEILLRFLLSPRKLNVSLLVSRFSPEGTSQDIKNSQEEQLKLSYLKRRYQA
jgi:hypothetical protein